MRTPVTRLTDTALPPPRDIRLLPNPLWYRLGLLTVFGLPTGPMVKIGSQGRTGPMVNNPPGWKQHPSGLKILEGRLLAWTRIGATAPVEPGRLGARIDPLDCCLGQGWVTPRVRATLNPGPLVPLGSVPLRTMKPLCPRHHDDWPVRPLRQGR